VKQRPYRAVTQGEFLTREGGWSSLPTRSDTSTIILLQRRMERFRGFCPSRARMDDQFVNQNPTADPSSDSFAFESVAVHHCEFVVGTWSRTLRLRHADPFKSCRFCRASRFILSIHPHAPHALRPSHHHNGTPLR
jgi:hypothetical protein